jgi:DNA invertase Pin-like site-specific DNA recombinase
MRAALYLRVSTDRQTTENQMPDLLAYCERNQLTIVRQYADVESGRNNDRVSRAKLLTDAANKEFDIVVVWKLDRWSRNMADCHATVTKLNQSNVKFTSCTEDINTKTASGELMFNMLASFAVFERAMLVQRIKAGLSRTKSEGKKLGPKFSLSTEKCDAVIHHYNLGHSIREIAKLTLVSRGGVEKILKRSVVCQPGLASNRLSDQTVG